MLMSDSKVTKWLQYACMAMLAVLILLQFTPFWSLGDEAGTTTSMNRYIWFPESNKDTGKYLEANVEDYFINAIVPTNVLIMVLGTAGVLLTVVRNGHLLTSLVHAAAGACGAWGYLTKAALQLGGNWPLHLALCIGLIACGVIGMISAAKEISEYRTKIEKVRA